MGLARLSSCGWRSIFAGVRAEGQRSLRFRKTRRSHFPVHELLQPFFRGGRTSEKYYMDTAL